MQERIYKPRKEFIKQHRTTSEYKREMSSDISLDNTHSVWRSYFKQPQSDTNHTQVLASE